MKLTIRDVLGKVKWFIVPYLVVLCACLIIKLIFTRETIYFTVNGMNAPFADFLAPYVTNLGDGITAITIAAIVAFFNYRKAFIIATSYAITSITAQGLKYIFDAPRPKLYFKDKLSDIHFVKGVDVLSVHSFPSGHTVTAFSLAIVFTYWCKNKAWGIVFLILAMLVGYSRMYLSEHFFEDVVAGSVIGVMVTVIWLYWIDNQKFMQSPKWNRGTII